MARARISASRKKRRGGSAEVVLVSRTVLCSVCGISERQLAVWEHEDLVAPAQVSRVAGREERLYDREALRRVRMIQTLGEELEVNLPGIGEVGHGWDLRNSIDATRLVKISRAIKQRYFDARDVRETLVALESIEPIWPIDSAKGAGGLK